MLETTRRLEPKLRSAFDGYNRGRQWEKACREVPKLNLGRIPQDQLVEHVVEAAGVESG